MAKDHGPSIKDDKKYETLRERGMSKEKAARIANTGKSASRKGGKSAKYEEWSREDLYKKAKDIGLDVNSKSKKEELVDALRNH
jgi:hypothetical protein